MTITLKIYSLFIALLWSNMSIAQMTKAKIQPVAKTGLYKMIVPAEIRSYSKDDLSDFRILDAQNNEVPYFLLTDAPEKRLEQFEEFAIVSKVVNSRKSTSIEIANPHAQINDLELKYQTKEKENTIVLQNEKLKQRTNLIILISLIAGLIGVVSYLLFSRFKNKKNI